MDKNRLEAFSDGVIAIIITIMVLELKVPHGSSWEELRPLLPVFLSYVLSFLFVGIYWNNHHHFLKTAERVDGRVLWANLHLLFWMSLIPFVSGWMGENNFTSLPVAIYGVIMVMSALAYTLLVFSLISLHGPDSKLASAITSDGNIKGRVSLVLYLCAIPLAFWNASAAALLYVVVAALWFVPDRHTEKLLTK